MKDAEAMEVMIRNYAYVLALSQKSSAKSYKYKSNCQNVVEQLGMAVINQNYIMKK
jgi:hypothetical protein